MCSSVFLWLFICLFGQFSTWFCWHWGCIAIADFKLISNTCKSLGWVIFLLLHSKCQLIMSFSCSTIHGGAITRLPFTHVTHITAFVLAIHRIDVGSLHFFFNHLHAWLVWFYYSTIAYWLLQYINKLLDFQPCNLFGVECLKYFWM